MAINIHIGKKDLWLLAAIGIFLVGVGYVIAYNAGMSGGTPSIMGHSSDEVMVRNSSGSLVSLQTLIDQGGFGGGGSIEAGWYSTCPNGWVNTRLRDCDSGDGPAVEEDSCGAGGPTVYLCLRMAP